MHRNLLLLMVLLLAGCSSTPAPTATLTGPPSTASLPPAASETPLPPTGTATAIPAVSFPAADQFLWKQVAGGDLSRPLDIQNAGDGSGRLFIVEQAGRIRIFQGGSLLPTPFLDIIAEVGSGGNEQGLLGLAFHPKYKENGLFFVNYTDKKGNTVLARFHVSNDPNAADPASEKHILKIDQPFANHNGGVLAFGPDGYLYAGLGDGGSQGDPFGNAQRTDVLLGKILR
ncbi:MAG TPA: PQQ-dependent sugar dehydrogenase, partial [Anaerolineales bacterium]